MNFYDTREQAEADLPQALDLYPDAKIGECMGLSMTTGESVDGFAIQYSDPNRPNRTLIY